MSGHSKWHNIQKTKGAADAKRAQAFTKIAREMIVAVKEGGGGDPRSNSKLAAVIAKAKAANMPNDNIKRTIDKALGAGNTENYEKIVYEGYGPQGVAVIVETMTDNRNRTAGEMRHYFDKYGGNMGAANCVSWSFDRKGVIVIDNEDEELDEDTVFEAALEAGADDVEYEAEINTAAKEGIEIDTICGTHKDGIPTARGAYFKVSGGQQVKELTRAGRTTQAEELLIGTLYSQFAQRRTTLSGEVEIPSPNGLSLFTEQNQGNKVFMIAGDVQDVIKDTTETDFVELRPDEYDKAD